MRAMREPTSARRATIRVGVAGWDYPDWSGVVYPRDAGGRFDRLRWLARRVDTIEINSTFYRPATPRSAASWRARTDDLPEFVFTAKAHRSWTHEREPPGGAEIEATLAGLEPLRQANRLGALLVQFPQSFHFDDDARNRLARLAERAADWPLVVEVRHTSWLADEAAACLRRLGLGWCAVDQPRVGRTTIGPVPRTIGRVAYLRLHGRNERDWFDPDAGRDRRYDWLYTPRQLAPLADLARRLADGAEELYVVQNNHYRGKAVVNALQLRHLLTGERSPAPAALVAAYPDLADHVTVERDALF